MQRLPKLISLLKDYYIKSTDPAHDWPHVGRVAMMAKLIAKKENVNLPILLAAVYAHDLVNVPKDHPDREKASELSAEEAKKHLVYCGFSTEEIALISQVIIEHSFSKGLKPSSTEAAILQDADRLDALGAIGILRCAAVNAQMKSSFYDPQDPLAESRERDDKRYMVDHYFIKLFKLPEMMNTAAGKAEGIKRVATMHNFLRELMNEIR